eukprot:1106525-Rhodomonas_salina.1
MWGACRRGASQRSCSCTLAGPATASADTLSSSSARRVGAFIPQRPTAFEGWSVEGSGVEGLREVGLRDERGGKGNGRVRAGSSRVRSEGRGSEPWMGIIRRRRLQSPCQHDGLKEGAWW